MKSSELIYPTPIASPLASEGTRNEIPTDPTGTNYASVKEGFPDMTMIAPADGGLPPWGQDMNGMLYMASDIKSFIQAGGFITFNQEECDVIGGYPEGAVLGYLDSSNIYHQVYSLIDDNTYNFVENPSYIDNEHWQYLETQSITWGSITGSITNQTDLYSNFCDLTNAQTVGGVKTFTSSVVIGSSSIGTNGSIELIPATSSTHGGYIDFHYAGSTADYTSRIIELTSGTITISGVLAVGSSLSVTSSAIIGSTLTVSNATTLNSTLSVSGTTTISGATTLNSTLSVSGATTLNSTLSVSGATTFSNSSVVRTATLSSDDSSTQIPTTAWVNSRITSIMDNTFQVVSELPSSPSSDVYYFIPEE